MQKQYKSQMFGISNILLVVLLYCFCADSSFAVAHRNNNSGDGINQSRVLQQIDSLLVTKYVLPEMAIEYAKEFRKIYKNGYYDSFTNPKEFAKQVTADLVRVTNDEHFHFRVIEASTVGETPESGLHHPVRYHVLGINENRGFSKLEWMEGNIGYLDIRRFYTFSDVKDLIVAAMNFLANANAIIIDLRENGGGSGDYLSSYFLEYPTQLNSCYFREDDFLKEYWTSKETGVEPLTDVPLFVLTSERTFSASESFAYDMKARGRATIIGDSTRGGAHSVDLYKVGDQFEIYIPTARAINPVTGGNWEGTGVIPDIIVPSETALDTAIVLARKAGEDVAREREAKLKRVVEEMETQMGRAEALFRDNRNDEAATALDSVLRIADKHGLVNEFFIDVLAYNYFSPKDEQILYAILKRKIEFFPQSPTAYGSLAYAYYRNNRKELAIATFETVLELQPDNRNAKKMIERLRNE